MPLKKGNMEIKQGGSLNFGGISSRTSDTGYIHRSRFASDYRRHCLGVREMDRSCPNSYHQLGADDLYSYNRSHA